MVLNQSAYPIAWIQVLDSISLANHANAPQANLYRPNSAGHILQRPPLTAHLFLFALSPPFCAAHRSIKTTSPPSLLSISKPKTKHPFFEKPKQNASRRVPSPHGVIAAARRHPRRPGHALRHDLPLRRLRRQRHARQGRAGCLPSLCGQGVVQGAHEAVSFLVVEVLGFFWLIIFSCDR